MTTSNTATLPLQGPSPIVPIPPPGYPKPDGGAYPHVPGPVLSTGTPPGGYVSEGGKPPAGYPAAGPGPVPSSYAAGSEPVTGYPHHPGYPARYPPAGVSPNPVGDYTPHPSAGHQHSSQTPPAQVQCGRCKKVVNPAKTHKPGVFSWLIAAGICLTGCWCFVWVPFVVDSTQDEVYLCPKCQQQLAKVKRI